MTADERLEALLNRAGQTISDLPKCAEDGSIEYYTERLESLVKAVRAFDRDSIYRTLLNVQIAIYALHLTDVIDRMETALENVCGERDYLRHVAGVDGCWTCTNSDSGMECHRPEGCVLNDEGRCVGYEYAGIPEDWRPEE